MKQLKRSLSLFLAIIIAFSIYPNAAFAKAPEALNKPTQEQINLLNEASVMLGTGAITEEEYVSILIEVYQLGNTNTRSSDYYPEVQAGYINNDGVVYLYEEGLRKAKTAEAAISMLLGLNTVVGWGIAAMGIFAAYGGKSALEKAVTDAYYAGEGVIMYYQIHKYIQSMNRVRYEVG